MSRNKIIVEAIWDGDASVWVATSNEVPGLVTEADTLDQLVKKLPDMIAEMLAENGPGRRRDDADFLLHTSGSSNPAAHAV